MGIVGFVLSLTLLLLGIPLLIVYPIGLLVLFSWLWVVRGWRRSKEPASASCSARISSSATPTRWRIVAPAVLVLDVGSGHVEGVRLPSAAAPARDLHLHLRPARGTIRFPARNPGSDGQLGADLTAPGFPDARGCRASRRPCRFAWLPWMIGASPASTSLSLTRCSAPRSGTVSEARHRTRLEPVTHGRRHRTGAPPDRT